MCERERERERERKSFHDPTLKTSIIPITRTQTKKKRGGHPNIIGAAKRLPIIPCKEVKKGMMLAIR